MSAVQSVPVRRSAALWRLAAGACLLAGLWIAHRHPLWPAALMVGLLMLAGLVWRFPWLGVWLVAAALPIADASVLTGPWGFDELDLLVLGVLAGCCLATSRIGSAPAHGHWRAFVGWSVLACAAGVLPWLLQPQADAAVAATGVDSPGLLVWQGTKALLWALALITVWRRLDVERPDRWVRWWLRGCVIGLALVCLLVLWELVLDSGWPMATPGYRTAAAFWEMRLGGGAIDVYLAVTCPMLLWLFLRERRPLVWWGLALLTVAAVQVLVSTQSRAVLASVLVASMLLLALVAWRRRLSRWRARHGRAAAILCLVLVLELAWGAFGASELHRRLGDASRDMSARWTHWVRGLSLLESPVERWLGLGAGQWSARYGAQAGPGEFPGQLSWVRIDQGHWRMRLAGPVSDDRIGALFGAVQRIGNRETGMYHAILRLRTERPVVLLVSVCERYLIYDRRCQWARLSVGGSSDAGASMQVEAILRGSDLAPDGAAARWRPRMFSVSLLTPATAVEIERIELRSPAGEMAVDNGSLAQGPARWVAAAQGRFEPWHMDNLYVQFWLERGLPGTAALLGLLGLALWRARALLSQRPGEAPALLASLVSLALLGLFISVSELPRLLLLMWLTLGASGLLRPKNSHIRGM